MEAKNSLKIEELLGQRAVIMKALYENVELNAGKPAMVPTEQKLIKERDAIDSALTELGYVKAPGPSLAIPPATPVAPEKRKRKRRKRESHSRAARAARAAEALDMLAGELESAADNIKERLDELEGTKQAEEEESPEDAPVDGEGKASDDVMDEIKEEVERITSVYDESFSVDEVQNLAEEMRSWSDNVQGTNLENTDKMQTVGETADAMESAANDLDGLCFPTFDENDIESFADELSQLADDIRSAVSDIEGCEFPGMYG